MSNDLNASKGFRTIDFRYDLLRNGIKRGEAKVLSGQIDFDSTSTIMRTASLNLLPNGIDWIRDTVRPVMIINGEDFPLGVFVFSTPTKEESTGITVSVECYDKTVILSEDCLTERLFIAKGTKYLKAVTDMLLSAGDTEYILPQNDYELPQDREFEVGTSKLEVINTLLDECNCTPLYANASGQYVSRLKLSATAGAVTKTYRSDAVSVLLPSVSSETDFYSVPNVFIATVSNPELEADLHSVYINDNPASPLSVQARGRKIVSANIAPDYITNQEALDEYVKAYALEASQVPEQVMFSTALMPNHEYREKIYLETENISGIYDEVSWSMELSVGGTMQHTVRREISV